MDTNKLLAMLIGQLCAQTNLHLLNKKLEFGLITPTEYFDLVRTIYETTSANLDAATNVLGKGTFAK